MTNLYLANLLTQKGLSMKNRKLLLLLVVMSLVLMTVVGGINAQDEEPFKVAFVYVAPIGDLGWTYMHEEGRLALEAEFGDDIETTFIENVPEGPDSERVIRNFAEQGYDVIVTTSFGYMDATATVALEFPDIQFVHVVDMV